MIHAPWPTDRLLSVMGNSELPVYPIAHRPRSGGIHLSDLYHRLYPPKKNDLAEDDLMAFRVLGLAMEDRIERALIFMAQEDGEQVERPAEMVSPEGIKCSLDLLSIAGNVVRVVETKGTWKGTRGLPIDAEGENQFPGDKFDIYFCQIMGYCYVAGTNDARLIAYFVNGNYTDSRKPCLLGWDLSFSDQEISENWDSLMTIYYDLLERQAERGQQ